MGRTLAGGSRLWRGLGAVAVALGLLLGPGLARAAGTPSAAETGPKATTIRMYPLQGGAELYVGTRTEHHEGGRVMVATEYKTPSGTLVQRTVGIYDAATLAPVSWRMDDQRSGEAERIDRKGAQVELSYRLTSKDALKSTTLPVKQDQLFTPTVTPLIERDWARLVAGQTVSFRLLVPSRLDSYGFRIVRDTGSALQAPGRVVMRMEPDSWFVRRLVDPLYFVFDAQPPHALLEFRGRSSIRTNDGDTQDLRMVFLPASQG